MDAYEKHQWMHLDSIDNIDPKGSNPRSIRRGHVARLKDKRKRYWNNWFWKEGKEGADKSLGRLIHTPALCSCPSCGNPRKHFHQRTIHEISFDQLYSKELFRISHQNR